MGKYLIVRCVDRTPLVLVDDYIEWLKAYGKDSERYEIYQEGLFGKLYFDCTYHCPLD